LQHDTNYQRTKRRLSGAREIAIELPQPASQLAGGPTKFLRFIARQRNAAKQTLCRLKCSLRLSYLAHRGHRVLTFKCSIHPRQTGAQLFPHKRCARSVFAYYFDISRIGE